MCKVKVSLRHVHSDDEPQAARRAGQAILDGRQPVDLTAARLMRLSNPSAR